MTQPNLLELAKQGDAQAIASLMNRQLQPKGITAKVALKDACLQIMLESAQVPNQQALVAFIRKSIVGLGAASIERVKIYGRQTGEEFPAWNQEFELVVHASSTQSPINTDSTFSSDHNQQLESPVVTHRNLPSKIVPENLKDNNIYYEIEGINGQIRLTHNRIIISQGLKGDKEIPISRITAMKFKCADALTQQGYLQFSIQGGIESKGGVFAAVRDENTVIFYEFEQLEFEEVKRYVNSVIDADPIDFDKLRFLELKKLKGLKIKEGAEKLRASREAVLTKKKKKPLTTLVKLLIGACFILFVFVLLTPQGSVFNTLSGSLLLIISLVFLCMALIKPD
jgi:DNA-binding transcriptional regulator YhcF (GntR family)